MKNKAMLIILVILFLITSLSAGVGYYYNSNRESKKDPIIEKGKVVYKYYLEDTEVNEMPKNETITNEDGTQSVNKLYNFLRFSCTNDLTGEFNEENWKFNPTEEKDSTCSLYFVNSKYAITLTVVNGTASEDNPKYIDREENGAFKITPHEGYQYKDAVCSDDKEATWNENDKTLLINAVTKDVMCKVNFSIQTLTAKITVVNGTGNTSESVEYGQSVSAIVSANDGYEKPKIECSNKQTATFENNKVTIQKLTQNTECKVTFNAVPVKKYKLTVELPTHNQVTIVGGSNIQEIEEGKTGTFTLKNADGYTSSISCGDVSPTKKEEIDSTTTKYTFLSMTKDISCEVTAKASEE